MLLGETKPLNKRILLCVLACAVLSFHRATAQSEQNNDQHSEHSMPKTSMADMNESRMFLMNLSSGTSVNPAAWPMPMIMTHFGNWNAMFMGLGFLSSVQQSGPRGHDKFYSTNWWMASAEHRAGSKGAFEAELMLSLEPATVTDRRYPLLFQTGETAFGSPLADAQHPHNFIMSLGFHYVRQLSEGTMLDLYFAPVGDPALGPVAYPHRASATEFPQAPLSHHLQDSTHIANEVVTAGVRYKMIKIEASGFYGSEPGENRWIIDSGPLNSWSGRLWFFPTKNWAAQVSFGRLVHPEASEQGDQARTTASLEYTRPMLGASWASTLAWGRTHNTATLGNLNSYLAESVLPLSRKNSITGRFELVDKDELFNNQPDLEERIAARYGSIFRIAAYTVGYMRDFSFFGHVATGIGANFSAYSLPDAIRPYYGTRPVGGNVFVRFQLRQHE